MDNTNPQIEAPETEAPETEAPDLTDDDLIDARPRVEKVAVELPSGKTTSIYIKRLTGAETIKMMRDAAKNGGKDPHALFVMKLTRCLVKPDDHKAPRFTTAAALELIERREAGVLNVLLSAIHKINPLIAKND